MPEEPAKLPELVTAIVSAYVSNNTVPVSELPALIESVRTTLDRVAWGVERPTYQPTFSVATSITKDYIVCLEDGRPFQTMKKHLRRVYGMTPDQYRAKWSLPDDYPMVAPSYAERRSLIAKELGLGRLRK